MEITEGTAQVFWISGSDAPVILLEATGSYSETITLPEDGNYIGNMKACARHSAGELTDEEYALWKSK